MTDLVRNLRRHPMSIPLFATAGAGLIWLFFVVVGIVHGSKTLGSLGDGPSDEQISLKVDLPFPPEAFHMSYFQRVGRIARTDGQTIFLRGVNRRTAVSISRRYWIENVTPWTEEAS